MDFASALKPLLEYKLSSSDIDILQDTIRAGYKADAHEGRAATMRIMDAAARKLARWYLYKSGGGFPDQIEQFRDANPDWPAQDELRAKAEAALFRGDAQPDEVKAFFAASAPMTAAGKAALASAQLADGDTAGAESLAVSLWRNDYLDASLEKAVLDRLGAILRVEDHEARINRLLYSDEKFPRQSNRRSMCASLSQSARPMRQPSMKRFRQASPKIQECSSAAYSGFGEQVTRKRLGKRLSRRRSIQIKWATPTLGGRNAAFSSALHSLRESDARPMK
jgi:hypothetical protein